MYMTGPYIIGSYALSLLIIAGNGSLKMNKGKAKLINAFLNLLLSNSSTYL